jgi:putative Ca2+/H+ antiporter (TMEM165/GDT1 family)
MDIKLMGAVFVTVFLAELGDKTQLAAFLFAAKQPASLLSVFVAASLALVLATALAVAGGALVSNFVDPKILSFVAGIGFIIIGVWVIFQAATA